jgi:hypothetical protein
MTTAVKPAPSRTANQRRANPSETGQPDPRPLTGYAIALSTVLGNTRVTVTLDQPCVVRTPAWAFIDANNGTRVYAVSMTVVDNTTFFFQFAGALSTSVGFIEVPYQDMQVQNFQGGFVAPGGRWFRKPV